MGKTMTKDTINVIGLPITLLAKVFKASPKHSLRRHIRASSLCRRHECIVSKILLAIQLRVYYTAQFEDCHKFLQQHHDQEKRFYLHSKSLVTAYTRGKPQGSKIHVLVQDLECKLDHWNRFLHYQSPV